MNDPLEPPVYSALALQLKCVCINGHQSVEDARAAIMQNVEYAAQKVISSAAFVTHFTGCQAKLVVLPEFVLTGWRLGESLEEWRDKAALKFDGPEYERLSETAQQAGVYLAGNAYEQDPHFPELYFQTCFIIAPNGDVILRYRRMTSIYDLTPVDIWDRYLDVYGIEGVFPVAKTEIGNLACIASEEVLWPELTRCHVYRGAELILHSTCEQGSTMGTPRDSCKQTRAAENMAYFISANTSCIEGGRVPAHTCCGMSKIIDYYGNTLVEAGQGGESLWANSVIELAALRRYRRRPAMANFLTRAPVAAYAACYQENGVVPSNTALDNGVIKVPKDPEYFAKRQREVIEALEKAGRL